MFKSTALPKPCISVGNIGWGGSGKTPLVDWLLRWSQEKGLTPCVLTRGYGGAPPHTPLLVGQECSYLESGDEPLMLACGHPAAHIVVDPKRAKAGPWAMENLTPAPDVFFLDDGFQHRAVLRQLDLVLLRPEDLGRSWKRVIPAGSWREGVSALKAADAFFVKAPLEVLPRLEPMLKHRLEKFGKPVFTFDLTPTRLIPVAPEHSNTATPEGQYILTSGVASPVHVAHGMERFMKRPALKHLAFPDHYPFTRVDWERIDALRKDSGAAFCLCTPKDAVKLAGYCDETLWTVELDLTFGPHFYTDAPFTAWWEERYSRLAEQFSD